MAVNKTTEPWPDERLSDLDHDSCMKLMKPEHFKSSHKTVFIFQILMKVDEGTSFFAELMNFHINDS